MHLFIKQRIERRKEIRKRAYKNLTLLSRSVITRDLILMHLSSLVPLSSTQQQETRGRRHHTSSSKKSKRKTRSRWKNYATGVDRKRIRAEQQIRNRARDGLARRPRKNPWLKMAVGWEWPYVGKTCSDLFPRTKCDSP